MKKTSIFILISALVVGLGVGLMVWHIRGANRAAIQQVIYERGTANAALNNANFYYIVKTGDTLPEIARNLGLSVEKLLSANKLSMKAARIKVGQKLINPAAIATATANYITELGKIDPSACPKPFRDAWINYAESWQLKNDPIIQKQFKLDESQTKNASHFGLSASGVQISSDKEAPNLHSAAERLDKLDNTEAWLKCKRVAMDYDVFVP